MKKQHLEVLVPRIFTALVLAFTVSAAAQKPPALTKSPHGNHPMPGHNMHSATDHAHGADIRAECQAMVARTQQMQDTIRTADAALDKLVAAMNGAKGSTEKDRTMAAVLNELVAQRKASHSMMLAMQPEVMAHGIRHMDLRATKGAMECPMMKAGMAHESKHGATKAKD